MCLPLAACWGSGLAGSPCTKVVGSSWAASGRPRSSRSLSRALPVRSRYASSMLARSMAAKRDSTSITSALASRYLAAHRLSRGAPGCPRVSPQPRPAAPRSPAEVGFAPGLGHPGQQQLGAQRPRLARPHAAGHAEGARLVAHRDDPARQRGGHGAISRHGDTARDRDAAPTRRPATCCTAPRRRAGRAAAGRSAAPPA